VYCYRIYRETIKKRCIVSQEQQLSSNNNKKCSNNKTTIAMTTIAITILTAIFTIQYN
jgi:hypothetical protein